MRTICLFAFLTVAASAQESLELTPAQYQEDFAAFWSGVNSTYAYFHVKATRWDSIPRLYDEDLSQVRTRNDFIEVLEDAIAELYDDHAHLTVNTAQSWRLVPSGTDVWAEWLGTAPVIVDVRHGSAAEYVGVRAGDIVIAVNGASIVDAIGRMIGRAVPKDTVAARNWALRRVLAGRHGEVRRIEVDRAGTRHVFEISAKQHGVDSGHSLITFRRLAEGVGYIRFNDSLSDINTIGEFDRALAVLHDTRGLVIDLRETPSGGNSTVARGILSRFVTRESAYQKHLDPAEERATGVRRSWMELVSPRGPSVYRKRVAVLVGRWTGSMGEGLAIGFEGVGRGTTVGGPMAQLLGATFRFELPNSKIGVSVPAERLYHVDGTPRETFRPTVIVRDASRANYDEVLQAGIRTILQRRRPGA